MKRKDAIQKIKQVLVNRRNALRKSVTGQLDLPKRDEAQTVGDEIDAAVESAQGELLSQLAAAESRELQRINVALERVSSGSYGICEECNKNIPLARLQAVPYATLCIKCQREMELEGRGVEGPILGKSNGFDALDLDITNDVMS